MRKKSKKKVRKRVPVRKSGSSGSHKKFTGKRNPQLHCVGCKESFLSVSHIVMGIVVLLLVLYFAPDFSGNVLSPVDEAYPLGCEDRDKNPCTTCPIVASCVQFEGHSSEDEGLDDEGHAHDQEYVHFEITNQNVYAGDCIVQVEMRKGKEVLSEKEYNLGELAVDFVGHYKVPLSLPDGESGIAIDPSCEWDAE